MIQRQQSPLTIHPINTHSNPLSTHQPRPSSSFVGARSTVDLSNFSHRPNSTSTFTDTQVTSNALILGSIVTTDAVANAVFIGGENVPLGQTSGVSDALSVVEGSGLGYEGKAIALTKIKGLEFYIRPKETFKFNFQGAMSLIAEGDGRKQREFARSKTTFSIYGTDSCGTRTLLDQLIIDGKQYNNRNSLSVGTNSLSKGFKLNVQSNSLSLASNDISFNGTYSRTFKHAMKITVVETQQTTAQVRFRGLRSA